MVTATSKTFIIDCPWCKAKVAATETGRAERNGYDDDTREPYAYKVIIGICPKCQSILAGETEQIGFEGYNSYDDEWSDVIRVYPKPPKTFSSRRIPRLVKESLNEADRSMQAGAYVAACVMLGRALEALCRNILEGPAERTVAPSTASARTKPTKRIMLGNGIKKLRDKKIIDDRLYDWSQQLQAFRNLAAHPEDITISRDDAEDLQTFVTAIVEYVYDLAERYEEFKARVDSRTKPRKF